MFTFTEFVYFYPADSLDNNQNANYEYYYLYYDEDGNVVDKSPPKAVTSSTASSNKAQEIPLVSTSVNSLSNSEETGDTPTIYAGLSKNSSAATSLGEEIL